MWRFKARFLARSGRWGPAPGIRQGAEGSISLRLRSSSMGFLSPLRGEAFKKGRYLSNEPF